MCMQSMYVCMSVFVCISIFLWGKPVTVMATSTSKSGTAHFTLNRYHVKNYCPFLFHARTQIFCNIFTVVLCFCIDMAVLVFNTSVCSPWQNFVSKVLNKEVPIHIFGSLPTTGEEE
jgi:hypothetical protein